MAPSSLGRCPAGSRRRSPPRTQNNSLPSHHLTPPYFGLDPLPVLFLKVEGDPCRPSRPRQGQNHEQNTKRTHFRSQLHKRQPLALVGHEPVLGAPFPAPAGAFRTLFAPVRPAAASIKCVILTIKYRLAKMTIARQSRSI